MALDNDPNDLSSSYEVEQRTKSFFSDADLSAQGMSPDEMHRLAVNSGNEGMYSQIGEQAASGRASQNNNVLMGGVDKNQQARDNSVADEMKSADISSSKRIASGVEHEEVMHEQNPDMRSSEGDVDMPVASAGNENPVMAAIYMVLAGVGISENQLNEAMGTDNSYRETLEVFHEMAEGAGITELSEYIQNADTNAMFDQLEAGVDAAPAIGSPEAELAVQPPEMQLDPEQNVAMSGPTAPAV